MKTFPFKYLIMSAIILVVFLGSSDINPERITSFLGIEDKPASVFATAHASMHIPEISPDEMACKQGTPNTLMPSDPNYYLQDFEKKLFAFCMNRDYDYKLGWCEDKRVRDTGPFIKGVYYGTHTPVRMYYSPRMMYWLTGKTEYWQGAKAAGYKDQLPRQGQVPKGAMVIKEMFYWAASATIYKDLERLMSTPDCQLEYEKLLADLISDWVVMIKTDETQDGWYYGGSPNKKPGQTVEQVIMANLDTLGGAPWAGYGLPCMRCHASATDQEMTFSDVNNVKGINPDDNLLSYRDDNSWRIDTLLSNYPLSKLKDYAKKHACLDESELEQLFQLNKNLLPAMPDECTYSTQVFHHGLPIDPAKNTSGDCQRPAS